MLNLVAILVLSPVAAPNTPFFTFDSPTAAVMLAMALLLAYDTGVAPIAGRIRAP